MKTLMLFIIPFLAFSTLTSAKTLTLKEWNSFDKVEQADIVSRRNYSDYKNLKLINYNSPEFGVHAYTVVENPKLREMGRKLWSISQDTIYMDNYDYIPDLDDSYIVLVGGPHQSYFQAAYLLENNQEIFLGAYSIAHEVGCEMEGNSDEYSYFDSEKEAHKNGCDFSDISWTGYLVVGTNYEPLQFDDYMEWTGW